MGDVCEIWDGNVRVLVEELGAVVDLIVDHHVDITGGVVLGNILHGEFLCGGHDCDIDCDMTVVKRIGGSGLVESCRRRVGMEEEEERIV